MTNRPDKFDFDILEALDLMTKHLAVVTNALRHLILDAAANDPDLPERVLRASASVDFDEQQIRFLQALLAPLSEERLQ